MELNLFDLSVLIIVGLSALLSFYRGFVREMLSLGGWIVASFVTLHFLEPATSYIKPQVKSEVIASGIAAVGLFFITLIVISIAANLLVKFLKPGDRVGLLDNLAGLVFGVARGMLIVAIGFFIMDMVTSGKHPDVVKDAISRPYVEASAKWLKTIAPDYLDKVTKGKESEGDDDLGEASKKKVNELIKKLDKSRDAAVRKVDQATDELDEKSEELPSMEDLQKRIREENEKSDVR